MSVKKSPEPIQIVKIAKENIPLELINTPKWGVWKWEWKGAKWDKPPLQITGRMAKTSEASHWVSFGEAFRATNEQKDFSGIGFNLGPKGSGYTVIDLDNCVDGLGVIEPWAMEVIEAFDSYTEYSPSMEGVKIWVKGMLPPGKWKNKEGNFEIYDHGRYLTVTGHVVDGRKELKQCDEQLLAFLQKHMASNSPTKEQKFKTEDREWTMHCIQAALDFLDPDEGGYDPWKDVGMALHSYDPGLIDLWDEWSAKGGKYEGREAIEKKWASFEEGGGLGLGTLFHTAKCRGFKMPRREYSKTDVGIAKRVCDVLDGRALYVNEWNKWCLWNGKRFHTNKPRELRDAIVQVSQELLAEVPEPDGTKEMDKEIASQRAFALRYQSTVGIHAAMAQAEYDLAMSMEDMNTRHDLFHCDNVVLRLDSDTAKVEPLAHNPEYRNTLVSSVVYNPDAECPRWEQFIEEVTKGDCEIAFFLQQLAGFCLTGRTDDQSLYVLYGNGRNGKGAFCRTLLKLLGQYGVSADQGLLMQTRSQEHATQFANLYRKRCVIAQETDSGCRLNEAQVKRLTGGDNISCRKMREDFWEFEPTHKLILATNYKPDIRGTDVGIWSRVKVIPFEATVKPDPKLEGVLNSELSGILNWAIEGFQSVVEWNWCIPKAVELARKEYQEEMDIVKQFVEEMCVLGCELRVKNKDFFGSFDVYCRGVGIHTPSLRRIAQDLARLGVTTEPIHGVRYKVGIGLKSEF